MAHRIASLNAKRALGTLGGNLKTARIKRNISLEEMGERIGVSKRTMIRLEQGDEGVSIGTFAMACLVLGEIDRISGFLDPGDDDTGLLLDRKTLPKRIGRKRSSSKSSGKGGGAGSDDDQGGVGF